MREDFLHYVWKFQKFDKKELSTTIGELVKVNIVGQHNLDSGPDFFNAQLYIGSQLWAGNVEIHIKSSDWYVHGHERDPAYDNVILHVVWEYDAEIFRKDNSVIPTIEIKEIVLSKTLTRFLDLFSKKHQWINCENEFAKVDDFLLKNWLETLYIERLEQKATMISKELKNSNNHWEALLFKLLSKNFGMKLNGDAFLSIAQSLDFITVQKCSQSQLDMESLLLGQAGLLDGEKEDAYFKNLQKNYAYLKHKFNLKNSEISIPKFFRLRPSNFPTIRLSQLSVLYSTKKQLFSKVIFELSFEKSTKGLDEWYSIFNISASEYWDDHYNFGVASTRRKKTLSRKFIDLLLVNSIIPLQFCYAKNLGIDISGTLLELASNIRSEENTIISKYNELRRIAFSARESQALLQLKSEYCDKMLCTRCRIGNAILKG